MIGNWNPTITRGGGWERVLTFTQSGAIFPLTDYTATMTMTPASGTAVTPTLVIDEAAGTITASLTATEVAAIDWDANQGVTNSVLTAVPPSSTGEAIELTGIAKLV